MSRNKVSTTIALLALAALCGCVRSGRSGSAAGNVAAVVTLPAGTSMSARLNQPVGTKSARIGDAFTATVTTPITAQKGHILIPRGATLFGHLSSVRAPTDADDQAVVRLAFDSVLVFGRQYPFAASIDGIEPGAITANVDGGGAVAVLSSGATLRLRST